MADRFGRVDKRHMLTTPVIGMALGAPILFLGYWIDEWHIALVLIFIPTVFNASYYGPTFACLHGPVRPEARAMDRAQLLFQQHLVGRGLGPLTFGILSAMLKPGVGAPNVRKFP